jgi:hypothetical protein
VTVGDDGVDAERPHVHRQYPETLDRVDHQQHLAVATEPAELGERGDPPTVKSDPRDGYNPGPLTQVLLDHIGVDSAVRLLKADDLDAPPGKTEPR